MEATLPLKSLVLILFCGLMVSANATGAAVADISDGLHGQKQRSHLYNSQTFAMFLLKPFLFQALVIAIIIAKRQILRFNLKSRGLHVPIGSAAPKVCHRAAELFLRLHIALLQFSAEAAKLSLVVTQRGN